VTTEVVTPEIAARTLWSLAFPGGDVGVEGRFNWLYDHNARRKAVLLAARKALPSADLTEFGISQGPYGIAIHFELAGERHLQTVELFATQERTRERHYALRVNDIKTALPPSASENSEWAQPLQPQGTAGPSCARADAVSVGSKKPDVNTTYDYAHPDSQVVRQEVRLTVGDDA
jgi:hypothetical protein